MPKAITKISGGDQNSSRDCAFNRPNANHPYRFNASRSEGNILKAELFSKEIMAAENSSERVQVRSFLKVRPINELLAVPLKPIEEPAKQQNVEVIKSLSKHTVESKLTEVNQSRNSKLQDNVKPKPKDSNPLPLVNEKLLSKTTVESKLNTNQLKNSKLHHNVKPKPKDSNPLPLVKEKLLSKPTVESKLTTNQSKNSKLHHNVKPKPKDSNRLSLVKEKLLSKTTVESKLTKTNQSKNSKLHHNVKPNPKDSNPLPLVNEKSLFKLTVESKLTERNQSKNSKLQDNVKPKPKDSNPLPLVNEKSLSKLTVESKLTESNQSKNSKLHDNIKPEPKDSNPLPLVNEKSLSELTVESKLTETNQSQNSKLQDKVKAKPKDSNPLPLESDKQKSDNQLPLSEDEIVLDDADVLRMDLSQELDVSLQYKENLSNEARKQIFIGNMPPSMKILYVSKFFERYGKINHVKFIRSKNQKKVICFITYDSLLATRASMETNGLLFRGYNLRVSRVGRVRVIEDATIVVTKLPEGTSNQDLYDLFEMCGLIKSQYLVMEIGQLVAYITFELKISVSYALQLNNFILRGCHVLVHPYKLQREKQGLSNLIL